MSRFLAVVVIRNGPTVVAKADPAVGGFRGTAVLASTLRPARLERPADDPGGGTEGGAS